MATVDLDDVWVHRGTDLATYVTFVFDQADDTSERDGDVQTFLNGRRAGSATAAEPRTVTYTCDLADRSDAETLAGWLGDLLLVRDGVGRKLWGVVYSVPHAEIRGTSGRLVDLTFTVEEVDHDESV